MAQFIIQIIDKEKEKFLLWSSDTRAPVSFLMNEEELRGHLFQEYGQDGAIGFSERIERARQHGTSCRIPSSVQQLIANNHAGNREQHLSIDEIKFYYRDEQTKAALERT